MYEAKKQSLVHAVRSTALLAQKRRLLGVNEVEAAASSAAFKMVIGPRLWLEEATADSQSICT